MNILVTGASGFIASQIVTDLLAAGHTLTCCVRNVGYAKNIFPNATIIACDFIKDTSSDVWVERLKNIDIVINCVGIFYHPNKKIFWAIHYDTPRALFDACVKTKVKNIIQISALGIDNADVNYAQSKKAAEDYLLTLPITAIILRPSLVYGRGSYGGTSLFRGLAGFPWFMPIPGKGNQQFQPIHLNDLAKAIVQLIKIAHADSVILNAVGPKRISLAKMLPTIRAWLGFKKANMLFIPLWIIRLASFFGDLIPYSAMNTTAYKMLNQNNISKDEDSQKFYQHIGFIPKDFNEGIYSQPSSVQDRWHAKLFFVRPLLQYGIGFIWLFSGICSAFLYPHTASYALLAQMGVSTFWQPLLLYGASALDIIIGVLMIGGYKLKQLCSLQIVVIIFYTFLVTWKLPHLWLEPFAPIIKNIAVILAIVVFMALERER